MITETKTTETAPANERAIDVPPLPPKRMVRLKPTQGLGDRFPAMHLVRSSWFARTLSQLVVLFLIGFTIAAIFLPWQQTSRCDGKVVARVPQLRKQSVESQAKGIVKFVNKELIEGSKVEEGQVILVLEPQVENQVELTDRAVENIKQKIALTKLSLENAIQQKETEIASFNRALEAVVSEVKSSVAKWKQTKNEISAQQAKHSQSLEVLERAIKLRGELYSDLEYKKALNDEKEQEQKLLKLEEAEVEAYSDLQAKQSSQQSKIKELEGKTYELDTKINKVSSELAQYEKDLTVEQSKRGEYDRLEVKSPSSGWIQSMMAQEGTNTVKEGDKLFEVVPDTTDLAVELTVNGNDFPLIQVGDQVRLQFEGWPAVQFVGWPSVAVGTFPGRVIARNPSDDSKGNFKILVGPEPNCTDKEKWPDRRYSEYYLRQGGKANAWVILRTVPLGFEIWRQLNGFPASKSDPGDSKPEKDPKLPKFK